jgi:hypothetical protein
MRRTFAAALFIVMMAVVRPGASGLNIDQDASWRLRNDRGNRYEGLVSVSTGNPDFEVLSFGYMEPFSGDVALKVRFFYPGGALSLTGREIKQLRQYWMEAKPQSWRSGAWNEFSPWPTGEVILRAAIPWNNLGVLVTLNENQLLPAITYHSRMPDRINEYTMYLKSKDTLVNVKFTLTAVGRDVKIKPKTWWLNHQKGGVPIPVVIDVRGFPEGFLKLVVEREVSGDANKHTREFVFYHKPSVQG